jgi:hypothetical protein
VRSPSRSRREPAHGPLAWGPAPIEAKADRLDVNAKNLSAVTIDPRRAGVDCKAAIDVTSDGPIQVTLAGC